MKISIDDTFYVIEEVGGENKEIRFSGNSYYSFRDLLVELLSASQYDAFVSTDTKRTFSISKKSEKIFREF